MTISASVETKRLEQRLKRLPRHLHGQLRTGLGRLGVRFHQFHRKERLSGPPGIKASLKRGGLVKQRKTKVVGSTLRNLGLKANIRSRVAVDHQVGRTIRPRRSRFLALPMPAAMTTRGVSSVAKRLLKNTGAIARAGRSGTIARTKGDRGRRLRGLFLIQSKGRRFLARPNKGGRPILLFHLQRSVKLRPRFKYFKTFRGFMRVKGRRILSGSLRHAVRRSA